MDTHRRQSTFRTRFDFRLPARDRGGHSGHRQGTDARKSPNTPLTFACPRTRKLRRPLVSLVATTATRNAIQGQPIGHRHDCTGSRCRNAHRLPVTEQITFDGYLAGVNAEQHGHVLDSMIRCAFLDEAILQAAITAIVYGEDR